MLLTHATEFYPYYRSRHAKFIDIKNSVFLSILKKINRKSYSFAMLNANNEIHFF